MSASLDSIEPYAKALREVYSGRLMEAATLCRAGERSLQAGALLGAIELEQGKLSSAGEIIRAVMPRAEAKQGTNTDRATLLALYGTLARLWRLEGDWEGALSMAETITEELDGDIGQGIRALTLVQRGDTGWLEEEAVRSLTVQPSLEEENLNQDPWMAPGHIWGVVWVRVAVARASRLRTSKGMNASAAVLQPVLVYLMRRMKRAEQDGLVHRQIELSILQSLALDALGDRLRALVALERSITLSLPGKYHSIYREQGEAMQFLLEAFRAEAARRIKSPRLVEQHAMILAHVDLLLASFPHQEKVRKVSKPVEITMPKRYIRQAQPAQEQALPKKEFQLVPSSQILANALTPREMDVLNLLAVGATYQEIADQLFVTLTTVRWHVHSLYRKLGVSNRSRAIARGRELNLLQG